MRRLIKQSKIDEFLNRELDNWDWIKEVAEKEIDTLLSEIEPKPFFGKKYPPMLHQKAAFLIGIENPSFLYFLGAGTGKTLISLSLFDWWNRENQGIRGIVIVPNTQTIDSWLEQIDEHGFQIKATDLTGSKLNRIKTVQSQQHDLYLSTYRGLASLLCNKSNKHNSKGHFNTYVSASHLSKVSPYLDFLVFDESHKIKNWSTQNAKATTALGLKCDYRYGLTGTPSSRDPQDFWNQFFTVDHGETLGQTLTLFRQAFFENKPNKWTNYNYVLRKDRKDHLYRAMKNRSIYYSLDECVDLPEKTEIRVPVSLNNENRKYYREVIKELYGKKKVDELENSFIRMRQITSGFLGYKDDETGDRVRYKLKGQPKADALMELLDSIDQDEKIVIFYQFNPSLEILSEKLTKAKYKFTTLHGGLSPDKKRSNMKSFKEDKDTQILLTNWMSGGTSLNLQIARYALVYEGPVSPIDREQMERRIYRAGQRRAVFIYDFVVRGTMDQKIIDYANQGRSLKEELLAGSEEIRQELEKELEKAA